MKNKLNFLFTITSAHISAHISYDLATELQKAEQWDDAITAYKSVPQGDQYYLSALFSLGCCYLSLGQIEQALETFNTILVINPTLLPVLYNRAYSYKTAGDLNTAINLYKAIIAMDESYDQAQLALGFTYLIQGDFVNGWKQHERYLKKSGKNGDRLRLLLQKNDLEKKRIILLPEGGLGDSLHFVRYAQRLHDMGTEVIVCTQKSLLSLFSLCPYIDKVMVTDKIQVEHHASATLMSLPAIFNDTEDSFPTSIPYLYADEQLVQQWQEKLAHDTQYKVGICWQADVHNDVSRLPIARRGCPLKHFALLQNILNVSLYSLQKFDGVEEIAQMPAGFPLHCFENLDETTAPFMETAAIMKNLNLIITVDTAVAHLAGGLGCEVWLLLPYATDWRWINGRTDSPWYPKMKIFKQKRPFDWESVMVEVVEELDKRVN